MLLSDAVGKKQDYSTARKGARDRFRPERGENKGWTWRSTVSCSACSSFACCKSMMAEKRLEVDLPVAGRFASAAKKLMRINFFVETQNTKKVKLVNYALVSGPERALSSRIETRIHEQ
jgi:hypothetical protein